MKKSTVVTVLLCVALVCVTTIISTWMFVSSKKEENDVFQPEPPKQETVVPEKTEPPVVESDVDPELPEETTPVPEKVEIDPPMEPIHTEDYLDVEVTHDIVFNDSYEGKVDYQWENEVQAKASEDTVRGFLETIYDFPERLVINEVTFDNNGIVLLMYHIADSDLVVTFEGDEWSGLYDPYLQSMYGDFAPIVWDNGIPANSVDVYKALLDAGYSYNDTIIRTNYQAGDSSITLRFSDGREETVQL